MEPSNKRKELRPLAADGYRRLVEMDPHSWDSVSEPHVATAMVRLTVTDPRPWPKVNYMLTGTNNGDLSSFTCPSNAWKKKKQKGRGRAFPQTLETAGNVFLMVVRSYGEGGECLWLSAAIYSVPGNGRRKQQKRSQQRAARPDAAACFPPSAAALHLPSTSGRPPAHTSHSTRRTIGPLSSEGTSQLQRRVKEARSKGDVAKFILQKKRGFISMR